MDDKKFAVEVTLWIPEVDCPDSMIDQHVALELFATWDEAVQYAKTWTGRHEAQIYPITGFSPCPVTGEPSPDFGPELSQ
jgi:hypothetical protein